MYKTIMIVLKITMLDQGQMIDICMTHMTDIIENLPIQDILVSNIQATYIIGLGRTITNRTKSTFSMFNIQRITC